MVHNLQATITYHGCVPHLENVHNLGNGHYISYHDRFKSMKDTKYNKTSLQDEYLRDKPKLIVNENALLANI